MPRNVFVLNTEVDIVVYSVGEDCLFCTGMSLCHKCTCVHMCKICSQFVAHINADIICRHYGGTYGCSVNAFARLLACLNATSLKKVRLCGRHGGGFRYYRREDLHERPQDSSSVPSCGEIPVVLCLDATPLWRTSAMRCDVYVGCWKGGPAAAGQRRRASHIIGQHGG